jgi:hypothetical protein
MFSGAAGSCLTALAHNGLAVPPSTASAMTGALGDEHAYPYVAERHRVARPDDASLGSGDGFVALVQGAVGLLHAVSVVVERAERQQLGERGQSADVIGVPMADDHVVDPCQAYRFRCGDDALRVAVVVAREAGVEQERLSVGRGEECGGASLNIDPGNLQTTAAGLGQRRADEGEHADTCRSECTCHVHVSSSRMNVWSHKNPRRLENTSAQVFCRSGAGRARSGSRRY